MDNSIIFLIVLTIAVAAVWLIWGVTLIVHGVWRGADRRDAERARKYSPAGIDKR